ncbi:amidohydrolase family protein [Cohnella sp. CFH 77786]|uniref:amidohydrolase family protein n=1 Tax=Cohnella sp. CFH 77786 TaxID=2662265 RepID=UPI001C608B98|nr:amidohydrolase family protein [Cohnella sp. CFH 77786]MBW5448461.1 amidohydrolase family protein [Cohnella sp. CFH 77786]
MNDNGIPLFDSLTHPTIDGSWLKQSSETNNHIKTVIDQMQIYNVQWALAVGMEGIGGYNSERYASFIFEHSDRIFPIAYFNEFSSGIGDISSSLKRLKEMGYIGIKIHPRFSSLRLDKPIIVDIIQECNRLRLVVMICTYFYGQNEWNGIEQISSMLNKVKECKVIMVHAGAVKLLEYIEMARVFTNVLLDLSFTLCKYERSSIDMDIEYAFHKFDRRICVGSDSPEFSLRDLRRRFDHFSEGLQRIKAENIAYRNLRQYITEW